MKKFIAIIISLVVLSMTALPAAAQTRKRSANVRDGRSYSRRYDNYRNRQVYRNDDYRYDDDRYDEYGYEDDRSIWQKHRDKITTAGGAAGGALLGGMAGGKKGAIIGAIVGGAGAAIYTYKIRDKNRRY